MSSWTVSDKRPERRWGGRNTGLTGAVVATLSGGSVRCETADVWEFRHLVGYLTTPMKARGLRLHSRWQPTESAGYLWVERRDDTSSHGREESDE